MKVEKKKKSKKGHFEQSPRKLYNKIWNPAHSWLWSALLTWKARTKRKKHLIKNWTSSNDESSHSFFFCFVTNELSPLYTAKMTQFIHKISAPTTTRMGTGTNLHTFFQTRLPNSYQRFINFGQETYSDSSRFCFEEPKRNFFDYFTSKGFTSLTARTCKYLIFALCPNAFYSAVIFYNQGVPHIYDIIRQRIYVQICDKRHVVTNTGKGLNYFTCLCIFLSKKIKTSEM